MATIIVDGRGYDQDLRMKLFEEDRNFRLERSEITEFDRQWAKRNLPRDQVDCFLQMVKGYRFRGIDRSIPPRNEATRMARRYVSENIPEQIKRHNRQIERNRQEREKFWAEMQSCWKWPWQK